MSGDCFDHCQGPAKPSVDAELGNEVEYAGPCVFCRHPAPEHDVDGECWVEGCACGTGETGDPQALGPTDTRPARSGDAP